MSNLVAVHPKEDDAHLLETDPINGESSELCASYCTEVTILAISFSSAKIYHTAAHLFAEARKSDTYPILTISKTQQINEESVEN